MDSLQAVIAELRAGVAACHADSITQAAMRASWEAIALRLERIDAEMRRTSAIQTRQFNDDSAKLRERLAAAEKLSAEINSDTLVKGRLDGRTIIYLHGVVMPALKAIAAEAREKAPPSK